MARRRPKDPLRVAAGHYNQAALPENRAADPEAYEQARRRFVEVRIGRAVTDTVADYGPIPPDALPRLAALMAEAAGEPDEPTHA